MPYLRAHSNADAYSPCRPAYVVPTPDRSNRQYDPYQTVVAQIVVILAVMKRCKAALTPSQCQALR